MMYPRFILTLFLAVLITGFLQPMMAQEFSNLEKQGFFQKYFHSTGKEWCLWQPVGGEKGSFNVSDDGYCHTKLDTTLFYTKGGGKLAVLIFGTYQFEKGDPLNCHGCAPLISISIVKKEEGGSWKTVKFVKDFGVAGSWGAGMLYRIQQFGKQFFLKQEGGFTNLGATESYSIFYHLPTLNEAIQLHGLSYYVERTDGGIDEADWEESIADISNFSRTLVLVTKKGFESFFEGKPESYDQKKLYQFNETKNRFVPAR